MGNIQAYNKFIVAIIVNVLNIGRAALGWDFGVDETTIATVVGAITSVLVFVLPNKAAKA
jgi:hypothetical protein